MNIKALETWCELHGLAGILDEEPAVLESWFDKADQPELAHYCRSLHSLRQLWEVQNSLKRGMRMRYRIDDIRRAVSGYLGFRLGRIQEMNRRAIWESSTGEKKLDKISLMLRDFRDEILRRSPGAEDPVFISWVQMEIDPYPPAITAKMTGPDSYWWEEITFSLDFSLMDSGKLNISCSCQGGIDGDPSSPCRHQRVLLEWTLDALHDPEDELHEELSTVLMTERWKYVLDEWASTTRQLSPVPKETHEERLAWRAGVEDHRLHIYPIIRKRAARGGWTRGRQVNTRGDIRYLESLGGNADRRLLLLMEHNEDYHGPNPERYRMMLEILREIPDLFSHSNPTRRIKVRQAEMGIRLHLEDGDLTPRIELDGIAIPEQEDGSAWIGEELVFHEVSGENLLLAAEIPPDARALVSSMRRINCTFPPQARDDLLDHIAAVGASIPIELPEEIGVESTAPDERVRVRLEPRGEKALDISFRFHPFGDDASWRPGLGPACPMRFAGGVRLAVRRDPAREREIASELAGRLELGEGGDGDDAARFSWTLDLENALEAIRRLGEIGSEVEVEWPADSGWRVRSTGVGNLRVSVSRVSDWFGVEGGVEVDGQKVGLADLLRAAREGKRFMRLGPGRFIHLEKTLRDRLEEMDPILFATRGGSRLATGAVSAERLNDALDGVEVEAEQEWEGILDRIGKARGYDPELPAGLDADLREYQREGFTWLARLAEWSGGACLADDMGLGKTLQVLVLLLHRAELGPALVVAPTSVGSVWISEAARFTPGLDVRLYRGAGRERMLENLGPGVVIVTSYDILAIDRERFSELRFATLAADEAQAIKNYGTRRARAVRSINAGFSVALTGTPLENHIGELWSIFRAIVPGLLGPWSHFRERFAKPIEKENDRDSLRTLSGLVRPFLLRRTKSVVAPELPPKTEIVKLVEMKPGERALYERKREEAIESMLTPGGGGGGRAGNDGKGRIVILAMITALRRLACHPRLVYPEFPLDSSKLETAMRILGQITASDERALVFSQFVGHLSILREALDARDTNYLYLDGSTPAHVRTRLAAKWRAGDEQLFLISLKAGGTGLNLPGADYVLHLDPWWNPAVEDQATDRTHRIGQTKPVTVVRLVSEGTIEEAVIELHGRKRDLAEGLLTGSDMAARLTNEELLTLVRTGEIDEVARAALEADMSEPAPLSGAIQPKGGNGRTPAPEKRKTGARPATGKSAAAGSTAEKSATGKKGALKKAAARKAATNKAPTEKKAGRTKTVKRKPSAKKAKKKTKR